MDVTRQGRRLATVAAAALLVIGVLAPSAVGASVDPPAAAGSISGKITDNEGNPVEAVLVIAYDSGSNITIDVTGSDGVYTIDGLVADDYRVLVPNGKYPLAPRYYDGSYSPATATIVPVAEGAAVSGIDIQLELTAFVSGTAVDANGEAIPTALTTVVPVPYDNWGGYASSVNPDGSFLVQALPITNAVGAQEGTAVPVCSEAWYDKETSYWTATPIPMSPGETVSGIDLVFDCGRVAGTVTDEFGNPLPGIGVQVLDAGTMGVVAEVVTDATGVYTTERLAGGDHLVAFVPPAGSPYLAEWFDDSPDSASATVLEVGAVNTIGIDATLTPEKQGFLRVTTDPALPVDITVDGIVRDGWGLNWLSMPIGSHEVCFEEIEGWHAPPCQTIEILGEVTTEVVGECKPLGYLRVTTSPALPSTIFVDGVPMNEWGVWTDLPPDSYEVCFGPVDGWAPPGCEHVEVLEGVTTELEGVFSEDPAAEAPRDVGYLRVTTDPPVGAKIVVDGVPRDSWGLNWLKVPEGTHEVCFGSVPNTSRPPCQEVEVRTGDTAEVVGTYEVEGFLRVMTDPPVPGVITVDGWPANAWGLWRSIPAGDHLVCFWPVEGFATPACEPATVTAGALTEVTGKYG